MKIISKYKDYYDYLTGIYGVDEKIVLDRTKFDHGSIFPPIVTFFIAGKRLDSYYNSKEDKFYFGQDLIDIIPKETSISKWMRRFYNKNQGNEGRSFSFKPEGAIRHVTVFPDLKDDDLGINKKYNCPIIRSSYIGGEYIIHPKLSETGIAKILPPQEIYLMLCEWLAPKDNVEDNMTDTEKIVAAGFDKKSSFRNIK